MAWKTYFISLLAAGPAMATQTAMQWGAPPAPEHALYCLRMEPVTGTRIGSIMCQTRQQWAEDEVDLDAAWRTDGVRVVA